MRTLTALTAAALAALVLAAPADAQGRGRRQMVPRGARLQIHVPRAGGFRGQVAVPFGRGVGVGPGIRARDGLGLFQPGVLVRQREFLELTDDQVARLEQLEATVQEARDAAAATALEHRQALLEAFEADQPDANAIRSHAQAMHDAQQAVQLAHLTATAEAKGLLTDEQRTKLDAWVAGARRGATWGGRGRPWGPRRAPLGVRGYRPIR
jgi:Spy/CpxP family protein refolding chaperone